jgi:hypothetical protein
MHPVIHCLLLAGIPLIPLSLSLFHPNFPILTKYIILIGAFGLTFTLYFYQFYRPFIRQKGDFLDLLLPDLFYVIDNKIRESRSQINNLRINVMIVRRKYLHPWQRYLIIDYFYPLESYKPSELELIYSENIGCSGTALYENEQIAYDSMLSHETLKGMPETHREVTMNIKSILSTPIYSPKDEWQRKPIAILNFDSTDDSVITGFNDAIIQEIAANRASLIGGLLI